MDGVHHRGDMHGFGRAEREENEPTFHGPWEAMARGLVSAQELEETTFQFEDGERDDVL